MEMSGREDGTGRRSEEPWAESPGDWLSGRGQEGRATKTWDRVLKLLALAGTCLMSQLHDGHLILQKGH